VVVKPDDAYGSRDPSAETEVPKDMLPADALDVFGLCRGVVCKRVKALTSVVLSG
jgi:hypothetical protein